MFVVIVIGWKAAVTLTHVAARARDEWQPYTMTSQSPLADKLIILIDSDEFLSSYIAAGLRAAGATIIGPARSISEAHKLILQLQSAPQAAVVSLDIHGGGLGLIVESLEDLGVEIVLTGRHSAIVPAHLHRWPIYRAPFASYQIVEGVAQLLDKQHGGSRELSRPAVRGH